VPFVHVVQALPEAARGTTTLTRCGKSRVTYFLGATPFPSFETAEPTIRILTPYRPPVLDVSDPVVERELTVEPVVCGPLAVLNL